LLVAGCWSGVDWVKLRPPSPGKGLVCQDSDEPAVFFLVFLWLPEVEKVSDPKRGRNVACPS